MIASNISEDTRSQVEAANNMGFLDRQRVWLRTMRQNMVKNTLELKSTVKIQEHILPVYSKTDNDNLVRDMHSARLEERSRTLNSRMRKRRINYFFTGNRRMLQDEDDLERDVDDLILAARAGNYLEVMDIVLHRSKPVSPNAVNQDGVTATYATLTMILKREVLDSEADLARLQTSGPERLYQLLFGEKAVDPKLDLVLRILLYAGGNVDFKRIEGGVDGTAVMHNAVETGALDMIDWLIKKGTSINIRTTLRQKTPLMIALEFNQLEVMNLLLRRGVMLHLELEDSNGSTALHYAASYARVEMAMVRISEIVSYILLKMCSTSSQLQLLLYFILCM